MFLLSISAAEMKAPFLKALYLPFCRKTAGLGLNLRVNVSILSAPESAGESHPTECAFLSGLFVNYSDL
jgi:hypothetical protein